MIRRLLGPAVVLAVLLGLGIPRAFADDAPPPSYYLALGDSLAAGYQPAPPLDRDKGYVGLIHNALATRIPNLDLENLGCDGATSTSMLEGNGCQSPYVSKESQLKTAEDFLRDHRGRVRLITIDIGGNDVNHCVARGTIDVGCATAAISTVATNLSQILPRLRAAAPGIPIIGMTYYDPFLAAWLVTGGAATAKLSVDLVKQLNEQLTELYNIGPNARVADVASAFDTYAELPAAPDGTTPLAVKQNCTLTWMCARGDIHPNDDGYQVIANTFLAEVPGYPQDAAGGLTDGSLTSVG